MTHRKVLSSGLVWSGRDNSHEYLLEWFLFEQHPRLQVYPSRPQSTKRAKQQHKLYDHLY